MRTTIRGRLWRAMRQLRRFDVRQLRIATATDYGSARQYVVGLLRTGYLVQRKDSLIIVRDSGPKSPRIRMKDGKLIGAEDLNTGLCHGVDGGTPPGPAHRGIKRTPPEPKPRRQWHPRWRQRRRAGGEA
jgi:hypothetical protein